ncbi:RelA/SpoT family protein [Candidatus Parcubacteria bacterium]|nr:RelA/SpoT family protein [Candidatus Parcubacteria bacterium]
MKDSNLLSILSQMQSPEREEIELVERAYNYVLKAHEGHSRLSGDPYSVHLVETAKILAELGMSGTTIAAGLLHDVVEDREVTLETIQKEFGKEIAFLVDGVTKLGKVKYRGTDRHNESLRKLFVAISQDIRVLIIKLADRLHNMRTLAHVPKEKQERIATETLEIYSPIAYRLGIRKLNRELEDLAFPYVHKQAYEEIKKLLRQKHHEQAETLEKFLRSVKKALAKEGLVKIRTEYRVKGLFSLYKKLEHKEDLEKVYDLNALRILVEKTEDCYRVLGIIHSLWRPLPGRIKDYIAFPKTNGYQALHTTVFTGDGNIVEVQIKTFDMHNHSEYGIASHVEYKQGRSGRDYETLAWVNSLLPKNEGQDLGIKSISSDVPRWIKDLVAYQASQPKNLNLKEQLKSDFLNRRIFIFSPKGDVVDLPVDSTPIDFAYTIHSYIGDHMVGSKVNGKLVSLDTSLKNGDIVEVMTKEKAKPSQKWLEFVKTSMARRHIRHTLSQMRKV